jgi:hypothetical protein
MTLNSLQAGVLPLPQLGTTHNEAVMVYASIQTPGPNGYQYGAGIGVVGAPLADAAPPGGLALDVLRSVSAQPTFAFRVPEGSAGRSTRLDIFDVSGRLIRRLVDAPQSAGSHEQTWTGHDDAGSLVAPGTYFVRLSSGTESATARVTLRR